jgi:hypothetical protein
MNPYLLKGLMRWNNFYGNQTDTSSEYYFQLKGIELCTESFSNNLALIERMEIGI